MKKVYIITKNTEEVFGGDNELVKEFGAFKKREDAINFIVPIVKEDLGDELKDRFLEINIDKYCDSVTFEQNKPITEIDLENFIKEEVLKQDTYVRYRIVELEIGG